MSDNEQRDELARELFIEDNSNQSREQSLVDWEWFEETSRWRGRIEHYKNMAAGMIAAGYRKPRTVLTGEELDALPAGAVILGRDGAACQKEEIPGLWGSAGELFSTDFVALPATVLWEPKAEATR